MESIFLYNDRISLRAVEPEDIGVMYEIENDPSLWDISNFTVPYSRYMLRRYIEDTQCDVFADKQIRLMIVGRTDPEIVIGMIDITEFTALHRRGEVGVVVRKAYRQQRYAIDALSLLCNYVFNYLSFEQLYAHIATDNVACIQLFTACGFEQCGCLKHWLKSGNRYKDAFIFQRLRTCDR